MSDIKPSPISFGIYYDEHNDEFTADLGAFCSDEQDEFIGQLDSEVYDQVSALADQIAELLGAEMKRIIRAEREDYKDRMFYEMSIG